MLYQDSTQPADARVRDLLGRMTRTEKFWQLFMIPGSLDDRSHDYSGGAFGLQVTPAGALSGPAAARAHAARIDSIQRFFVEHTRLGVPIIPFEEGLHGIPRPGATAFPQAIGLAATWDTALMGRVSQAIAQEARSRGIRQVLSPVINIASDVRWGRTEETYGEDPFLTGEMARAYVSRFERAGVIATPKHFVANVGEGGRDSYPIEVSRRKLEEVYFPPFRAALEAGARSVMTAYNSVDGDPATQNRWLLSDKLKGEWKFPGFVISDAAATGGATVLHMTEVSTATAAKHAIESGLDVIFQSSWEQHRPYLDAFEHAGIPDAAVDSAVARVLRAKFQLGLFEHPYVDPDSAARWNGSAEHRALALEAAGKSIVLLKNERSLLPLSRTVRSVAVIGVDAVEGRLGGYSGPGNNVVSILDGLKARLGGGRVHYAPGPGRVNQEYEVIGAGAFGAGLKGEYFANTGLEGTPSFTRTDSMVNFSWPFSPPAEGLSLDWFGIRWSGPIKIPAGLRRIGVEANDGYRLYLDGKLLIDRWTKRSAGAQLAAVRLVAGSTHAIRLEYFESTGNGKVKLVWDAGVPHDSSARISAAVGLARSSSVAIVVAGIEEGEFRDRARLGLPGHQVELIRRVAATGTPLIVVLIGGSAITMPWLDQVGAVVDAWYPGEAGGEAVAEVLLGETNPGGRLPITFPLEEGQLPLVYNHKPTGRGDDYVDLTGSPLFPFGYGLSYTSFEYSDLRWAPATIETGDSAVVTFRVKNIGPRDGDEVVQLYLRDQLASVARPVNELKGFRRVHLAAGEEREIQFVLTSRELRMLDREMKWVVEPGEFRVAIGSSSRDIRLRGIITVR